MLNISADDFIALLDGVAARIVADGVDTPQCFDVAQLWARVIGSPKFTGATADLIYNQPGDLYTQIPNTPDAVPQLGDLVIWNWPHVAIATGKNSDTNTFEVLEQNDPTGSECHIKSYNYSGVIGFLRPKQSPQSLQALVDTLRTARDTNWNLYQAEVTKNAQLSQNVATLQGEVIDLKAKYDKDEQTIITLKGQISDLSAVLQKTADEDKQYAAEALDAQHALDALQGRFTTLLGLLALSPDATDEQIKARITTILLPHEQLVKETMPVIEELWQAAVYKRVPKMKSFFHSLLAKVKASLDKIKLPL